MTVSLQTSRRSPAARTRCTRRSTGGHQTENRHPGRRRRGTGRVRRRRGGGGHGFRRLVLGRRGGRLPARVRFRGLVIRRGERRLLPARERVRREPGSAGLREPLDLRAGRLPVGDPQRGRDHVHGAGEPEGRLRQVLGAHGADRGAGQHPGLLRAVPGHLLQLRRRVGVRGRRLRLRVAGHARHVQLDQHPHRRRAVGRDRPQGRDPLPALQPFRPARQHGLDLPVRHERRRRAGHRGRRVR